MLPTHKFTQCLISLMLIAGLTACASTDKDSATTPVEKINAQGEPEGYEFAVWAKEKLTISGTVNVAYGANGKYAYKYNQTKDMQCNNAVFGDPIKGTRKKCYIQRVN